MWLHSSSTPRHVSMNSLTAVVTAAIVALVLVTSPEGCAGQGLLLGDRLGATPSLGRLLDGGGAGNTATTGGGALVGGGASAGGIAGPFSVSGPGGTGGGGVFRVPFPFLFRF